MMIDGRHRLFSYLYSDILLYWIPAYAGMTLKW